MVRLEQILKGIQAQGKKKERERLPISINLLRKLKGVWQKDSRDGGMLWAAASLCFFGFFRSGEITIPSESAYDESAHLSFQDVQVDCKSSL